MALRPPTDTVFLANLDSQVTDALVYELCVQVRRFGAAASRGDAGAAATLRGQQQQQQHSALLTPLL
jgi:hypothetical protein